MASAVPEDLLQAVRTDLRPVRPLPPPWRRALTLAPLGVLLVIGVPAVIGWRSDLPLLGRGVSWLFSGLQALLGLWILGAALREAVPGRALAPRTLSATALAATLSWVGIMFATAAVSPHPVPPGAFLRFWWECYGIAAVAGVPMVAAVAWLAARALPTRPALTGALYGLGAGLVSDSGMRLFCWVSDPAHVLISHGGAIASFMAIGAAVATLVDRRRG